MAFAASLLGGGSGVEVDLLLLLIVLVNQLLDLHIQRDFLRLWVGEDLITFELCIVGVGSTLSDHLAHNGPELLILTALDEGLVPSLEVG